MRRGEWPKLLARAAWRLRLRLPTRPLKTRVCYASGFGAGLLGRCGRSLTGPAVRFGRKGSSGPKTPSPFLRAWIGIYGLGRRQNAPTTMPTRHLYGGDGPISVVVPGGTGARDVSA